MIARIVELALGQRLFVMMLGVVLLFGGLYAFHVLDVVAYPDPSPPMVEVITQYPGWSAEEIERQITIPLETVLNGTPGLTDIRSLSIFGLSDIKVYFDFKTDYYFDRQEVLNRIQLVNLPAGVLPQLSPWSAIAEIYRYELVGPPELSLSDLKAIQDWQLQRKFKQVRGVIDVTAFGGTTKEYHVDVDPRSLAQYNVTLGQVLNALTNSNANVGGNYLTIGPQSFNVRGVGLIRDLEDIENVVVVEKAGAPIYVRNVAEVSIGKRVRLGKVGIDDRDDVLEGVVLLQRGAKAIPTLERVRKKIVDLNNGQLPPGVRIKAFYDRTDLIEVTIRTVLEILAGGMILVFLILFIFLGHMRAALIVALTVPLALLFTFSMMVTVGESANLISLGAIDFGIIVDAALIMVEAIFLQLSHHSALLRPPQVTIVRAARHVGRPIFFSTLIILVAFIPLFTMTGVPGKIFAPMSLTYGFALFGALLIAVTLSPVLCSFLLKPPLREEDTRFVAWLKRRYLHVLRLAMAHRGVTVAVAAGLFVLALVALPLMGGEFMPALEEGNLWVRATMPVDISFDEAARIAAEARGIFRSHPAVQSVASQLGRPDDGTDPTSFFNAEFFVNLKPKSGWPSGLNKEGIIRQIEEKLKVFPGITFNFSQAIQDNVEEAMSGVKGENSIKLFGRDLAQLETTALQIEKVMKPIAGVRDLGVFRLLGQPNLLIEVDRNACARYGVLVGDVNAVVQAAIGGQAVTQVLEGERRFDLVVRFLSKYRQDVEAISEIQVSTPDGPRIPLKQLAKISTQTGAFIIYRENNERYIPIKFSVRNRDLEGTVREALARINEKIPLPPGLRFEVAGQYDQLQDEKGRLAVIVPVSLLVILFLLYLTFNSFKDAFLVLATVPFALVGGIFSLVLTGTHFSISAAVGIISLLGVAILGGVLLISRIDELLREGISVDQAIVGAAESQMRPILMATLGAAIGLLPAAVSTGIGSQAQQPLARVVVGGMITAAVLILVVLPVLYSMFGPRSRPGAEPDSPPDPPPLESEGANRVV
ncbi:MAG: efflux RND transporter permease subunit [Nitrospirae bacterium]|nr:MAG: efflux RND transporter permease subunit [Nitrospirota bacterium]